jgi:hypothetical protein
MVQHRIGVQTPGHLDGQTLPGVFIDDGQERLAGKLKIAKASQFTD